MSAWSEYNAGLLTEAEYNGICKEDEWLNDHYVEPCEWDLFDDDELVDGLDLLDEEDLFLEDDDEIND